MLLVNSFDVPDLIATSNVAWTTPSFPVGYKHFSLHFAMLDRFLPYYISQISLSSKCHDWFLVKDGF